jgi:DNA polymerase-3 subunit beta
MSNITVARRDLLAAVERVCGVADSRSTMPILSHVLLVAQGAELVAHATNLDIASEARAAAEVVDAGKIAVPAREFISRVKAMPEGPVRIVALEGAAVRIVAVGAKREFRLRGMLGEDFPAVLTMTATARLSTLTTEAFLSVVRGGAYAISHDLSRPFLSSALMSAEKGTLRIVTTDGHRLGMAEVACECADFPECLVPRKALEEIVALAKTGGGLDLRIGERTLRATVGSASVTTKLIEQAFPPWQQLVPRKAQPTRVAASRAALLDAIRAVATTASERTRGMSLVVSDGSLRISAESSDLGDGVDELEVDTHGPAVKVGVNARYLLEAISALENDTVTLGMGAELDPVLVQPAVGECHAFGVVMPQRL